MIKQIETGLARSVALLQGCPVQVQVPRALSLLSVPIRASRQACKLVAKASLDGLSLNTLFNTATTDSITGSLDMAEHTQPKTDPNRIAVWLEGRTLLITGACA